MRYDATSAKSIPSFSTEKQLNARISDSSNSCHSCPYSSEPVTSTRSPARRRDRQPSTGPPVRRLEHSPTCGGHHPQNLPVRVIRDHVDVPIRSLLHVTDSFPELVKVSLFLRD